MFWERYKFECERTHLAPSRVAFNLNIGLSVMNNWKNGATPQQATLKKLADYFNCSVEYLQGQTDYRNEQEKKEAIKFLYLSDDEKYILKTYQDATQEEKVKIYSLTKLIADNAKKDFWGRFYFECEKVGKSPTPVLQGLGISRELITSWKKGATPQQATLKKLANYFGCSVDYLIGRTNQRNEDVIK